MKGKAIEQHLYEEEVWTKIETDAPYSNVFIVKGIFELGSEVNILIEEE